jgi:hypothetical protein
MQILFIFCYYRFLSGDILSKLRLKSNRLITEIELGLCSFKTETDKLKLFNRN